MGSWYAEQTAQKLSLKNAMIWWLRAARKGHANAQHRVATHYEMGTLGIKQSTAIAHQWYQRAAKQGHDLSRQKMPEQLADATTALV